MTPQQIVLGAILALLTILAGSEMILHRGFRAAAPVLAALLLLFLAGLSLTMG